MPSVVGKGASVAAVSPTLPATVQTAVAPAPEPKPATATLPAASTGARSAASTAPRTTVPARSTSTSAEEVEKAARRASYAKLSAEAQESLARSAPLPSATALQPYLKAVGRIAELRQAGEIGLPKAAYGSNWPASAYPSVQAVAKESFRDPKGRGTELKPSFWEVSSATRPEMPESLQYPVGVAMRAKEIDEEYAKAAREYQEEERRIRMLEEWRKLGVALPSDVVEDFPTLAKAQRARLQRVAELAAARREYGLID